jgi:3-dehydroquinate dehydratase-2
MNMKILILNGPNLNLLGQREPEIYGSLTLDTLNRQLAGYAQSLNEQREGLEPIELFFYQSNHEGILVDTIHSAQRTYAGIVFNPAAYTHYSIALRDAVASVTTPVVEVHLSNIAIREPFRTMSVIAEVCIGQFMGKGINSYIEGLNLLVSSLSAAPPQSD